MTQDPDPRIGSREFGTLELVEILDTDAQAVEYRAVYIDSPSREARVRVARFDADEHVETVHARFLQAHQTDLRLRALQGFESILAVEWTGDGAPAAIMAHEKGQPLETTLRTHAPLEPPVVQALVTQLVTQLEALHRHGLSHNRVEPRSVSLISGPDQETLVTLRSVGISRQIETYRLSRYTAPERITGDATPAADIFGVGALVWWALSGEEYLSLFEEPSDLFEIQFNNPVAPDIRKIYPVASRELAALIGEALHPNPRLRPDAREFLDRWLDALRPPSHDPLTLSPDAASTEPGDTPSTQPHWHARDRSITAQPDTTSRPGFSMDETLDGGQFMDALWTHFAEAGREEPGAEPASRPRSGIIMPDGAAPGDGSRTDDAFSRAPTRMERPTAPATESAFSRAPTRAEKPTARASFNAEVDHSRREHTRPAIPSAFDRVSTRPAVHVAAELASALRESSARGGGERVVESEPSASILALDDFSLEDILPPIDGVSDAEESEALAEVDRVFLSFETGPVPVISVESAPSLESVPSREVAVASPSSESFNRRYTASRVKTPIAHTRPERRSAPRVAAVIRPPEPPPQRASLSPMLLEMLVDAAIDAEVFALFASDRDQTTRFMQRFAEEVPGWLLELDAAFDRQDSDIVQHLCARFEMLAQKIGARRFRQLPESMALLIEQGEWEDAWGLIDSLEDEYSSLFNLLAYLRDNP